ncbi:ferritin-like domain-containing protein [Streptomyces sp. NPDC046821]|uniref:ferritin-like domain-containing protein n=1 Tax=Streptomyces sp. NPDC046821 TaxID=3154702 RepID=UPI0033D17728
MITRGYEAWVREFEGERERREAAGDPDWGLGARVHPAVWRSVRRFQVGESGDGANLIAKADRAGDAAYARAVRLFVAEEQNHARLLGLLLGASGVPPLVSHWSDTVFVRLRRLLGLRLELLVLMVAEVVALRYYRALRDGTGDALTTRVAGAVLADEERHVPFHCDRLREAFRGVPRPVVRLVLAGWRGLLLGAALVVACDHGSGLRRLGVGRWRFVRDVVVSAGPVGRSVVDRRV